MVRTIVGGTGNHLVGIDDEENPEHHIGELPGIRICFQIVTVNVSCMRVGIICIEKDDSMGVDSALNGLRSILPCPSPSGNLGSQR